MDKVYIPTNSTNQKINTIKKKDHLYVSYNDTINEYIQARKNVGFCNETSKRKIMLYGSRAINLINYGSTKRVDNITNNAFFTLLMNKKKLISEILVIKISALRYLIFTDDFEKTFKFFNKYKKRFPLVTIDDASDKYSLFSFHGERTDSFFNQNRINFLYKTKHQNYSYYLLLVPKKDEVSTISYYKDLNFTYFTLETKSLFLYNNGVVTNLQNVNKKYRLNIYKIIYRFDNVPFKIKDKYYTIRQYELQQNVLVSRNQFIYNHYRKKVGIIHCSYRLPNKRNPYIIGIVKKYNIEKTALIKDNKKEVLIKQFINY